MGKSMRHYPSTVGMRQIRPGVIFNYLNSSCPSSSQKKETGIVLLPFCEQESPSVSFKYGGLAIHAGRSTICLHQRAGYFPGRQLPDSSISWVGSSRLADGQGAAGRARSDCPLSAICIDLSVRLSVAFVFSYLRPKR